MGLGNWQIITRHVLPNSLTPVVTFLPFRISGAILALTSLDFLGPGRAARHALAWVSLLSQGKNNIDAWWISLSTFAVLVLTLAAPHLHGRRAARRARPAKGRTHERGLAVSAQPCAWPLPAARWCTA